MHIGSTVNSIIFNIGKTGINKNKIEIIEIQIGF